jgi:hypothetical protein
MRSIVIPPSLLENYSSRRLHSPFSKASNVPSNRSRCWGSSAYSVRQHSNACGPRTAASALDILKNGASNNDKSSSKKWPPRTLLWKRQNALDTVGGTHRPVPTMIGVIEGFVVPSLLRDLAPGFSFLCYHAPELLNAGSIRRTAKADANYGNGHFPTAHTSLYLLASR